MILYAVAVADDAVKNICKLNQGFWLEGSFTAIFIKG